MLTQECLNRVGAYGDVADYDALFVDEIGYRCGEHGVSAGDFPLLLEDDGKRESVLFDLGPVFFRLTFADHDNFQFRLFAMEFLELWCQRVARPTTWAGENQQHTLPTQIA